MNKFRLVDNGVVSFSNPARQNFYTFDDCVAGNLKVDAAAAAMKKIDPSVVSSLTLISLINSGSGSQESDNSNARTSRIICRGRP